MKTPNPNDGLQSINAFLRHRNLRAGVELAATGEAASIPAGDLTGRYHVGAEIAKGGMGAILRAKDLNTQRSVAMKVMLPLTETSDESVIRFIEEAQITAQLEHPGIVPVYELAVDAEDNVYYTMKFVRGVTLKDIIHKLKEREPETIAAYPLNRLLNLFIKICETMAYAHSKGVIHRDLKPENIMIGAFGEVMIMDWGIAKVTGIKVDDESDQQLDWAVGALGEIKPEEIGTTIEGQVLGTPAFMAPEQALGQISKLDGRSDIYALGGILYQLLALDHAVPGKLPVHAIMLRVVQGQLIPIHETAAATKPPHLPDNRIPDSLAAVVAKAMAVDQDDRYPSATKFLQDLEAWQAGRATEAENASLGRQLALLVRRHRVFAVTAACVILLCTGFIVRLVASERRARENEAAAKTNELRAHAAEKSAQNTLAELVGTVPSLIELCRTKMEEHKFDEAYQLVGYALSLTPTDATCWRIRGDILQAKLDLPGACEAYRQALVHTPGDTDAVSRLKVSEALLRKSPREGLSLTDIGSLQQWLTETGRFPEASFLASQLASTREEREQRWMPIFNRVKHVGARLSLDDNGTFQISTGKDCQDWTFLRHLRGIPVDSFAIGWISSNDLSFMEGFSPRSVTVHQGVLKDISALRGMPLETVRLEYLKVASIEALRGMKLRKLHLCLPWFDLSPIRGMPLEDLLIEGGVSDFSPIHGMKLRSISISCRDLDDISFLAPMPLETVEIHLTTKLRDISSLRGKALRSLNLTQCTALHDISALKGMPLHDLTLISTSVRDLAPLEGIPLQKLALADLGSMKNTQVLSGLTELRVFSVQETSDGMEHVRQLPKLTTINGLPADQFWKQYDAAQAAKTKAEPAK